MLPAVSSSEFHASVTTSFTFTSPVKTALARFHASVAAPSSASHADVATAAAAGAVAANNPLASSQIPPAVSCSELQAVATTPAAVGKVSENTALADSQIPPAVSESVFQADVATSDTETSPVKMPLAVSNRPLAVLVIASHADVATSFTLTSPENRLLAAPNRLPAIPVIAFQASLTIGGTVMISEKNPVTVLHSPPATSVMAFHASETMGGTVIMLPKNPVTDDQMQEAISLIPSQAAVATSPTDISPLKTPLIPSQIPRAKSLIPFQSSVTLLRKSSFVFHNVTSTAEMPAIAAITIPTGPVTAATTFEITGIMAGSRTSNPPTPLVILERIKITGPAAAANIPIFAISFCCAGVSLLNLLVKPWTKLTTFWIVGASASPSDVTSTSMDDFSCSIEPPNPPIMASAISSVVPAQFSRLPLRSSTSSGAALISASHGAIWFLPKIVAAASICWASLRFAKASCNSL